MSRLTQGKCYDPMGSIPAGFPAAAGIGSYEEKDEIFFFPANNVPLLQIDHIKLIYLGTESMIADFFTKVIVGKKFESYSIIGAPE